MEEQKAKELIAAAIKDPRRFGINRCCTCPASADRRPYMVGLFIPKGDFGKMIGEPEGKSRVVVYAICRRCFDHPDRNARVEAALVSGFSREMTEQ